MKTKPVIGIIPTLHFTSEEENNPYENQARFVRMYAEKIKKSGGIPIGILDENIDYTSICDGYLWPGGTKILKEYAYLLEDAIKNNKPVLGICLGAQTIATFLNILEDKEQDPTKSYEEIYEKNKEEKPYLKKLEENSGHRNYVTSSKESIDAARHKIHIEKDSLLYQIYKTEELNVVSLHSFAINRVPKVLNVLATSEDGVIEAIAYNNPNTFILGVQFHPEIEEESTLFDAFIRHAKKPYQLLVNKTHKLEEENKEIVNYTSEYDTSNPNMDYEAYLAWEEFKSYARKNGYYIDIESAYRSVAAQQKEWDSCVENHGLEHTKRFVAVPGYSEHHTGLALDICMKKEDVWINEFHPDLKDCYAFLKENCAKFGFILRYPEGKEEITGYGFEPWHFRYVGNVALAKYIMENNLTLEEYLEGK